MPLSPKRQKRNARNSAGDKIGGQFKGTDASDMLPLGRPILPPSTSQTLSHGNPFPSELRTIVFKPCQDILEEGEHFSNADTVEINKDPATGVWTPNTVYGFAAGEVFADLLVNPNGPRGTISEIVGYQSRVASELANQGDFEMGNTHHLLALRLGVGTAGALLKLPGRWGRWSRWETERPSTPEENIADIVAVNKDASSSLNMPSPDSTESRPKYSDLMLWANLPEDEFFRHRDKSLTASGSNKVPYPGDSSQALPLLYAASFQDITQRWLATMPGGQRQALTEMWQHIATDRSTYPYEDLYHSIARIFPDQIIAQEAFYALAGERHFPNAGHDNLALLRYINNSATEQTSHIFEPSYTAVAQYCQTGHNEHSLSPKLADFLDQDFMPGRVLIDDANTRQVVLQVTEKAEDNVLLGDIILGRRLAVYNRTNSELDDHDLHRLELANMRVPDLTYQENGERSPSNGRSSCGRPCWGGYRETSSKGREGYAENGEFPFRNFIFHPEIQKIPLAVYTMATLNREEPARKYAEHFLEANNFQPLAASMLHAQISKAKYRKQYEENACYAQLRESHHHLLHSACVAWAEFAHNHSWYVKPGGKLDPANMLAEATKLKSSQQTF